MDELNKDTNNELDSLEEQTTLIEPHQSAMEASSSAAPITEASAQLSPPPVGLHRSWRQWLWQHFNIYLLLFLLLLVIAGVGGSVLYFKNNSQNNNQSVPSQSLSQSTLNQLANSDVAVGEPQHTLSVQSNAVFAGDVLIRSNLQIAGTLQVGSNLAINGIRVTGNSTFDDVQITQSLALTGNESIQGQLNIQKSLSVSGSGTFSGSLSAPQLTVGALQLNGDLSLTHHIAAGGSTPRLSGGTALGSGGTASVSGSDTAGSITINTGGSPAAGCFATITFAAHFNTTPHISLTPVGAAAANVAYYITRTTTTFSVCSASAPPAGVSFGFDYLAFD